MPTKNPAAVAIGSLGGKTAQIKYRFVCHACEKTLRRDAACRDHPYAIVDAVLRSPEEQAAARLGARGGKATAAKFRAEGLTQKQIDARSENAKKATAARLAKAAAKKLDEALTDPSDGDDTDLHMPWTY